MLKFEAKKGDFAKIWQKLGEGGLQPSGSAAHVFLNVLLKSSSTFANMSEVFSKVYEIQ